MTTLRIVGYVCAVLGVLLSLWWVALGGAVLLIFGRAWVSALLCAFVLDLLYGSLPSVPLLYPFTAGIAVLTLLWELVGSRLRGRLS